MTERLSNKNPCNDCKIDRRIGNPNRWECECDMCSKTYEWKNDCIKKLAEYETAEEKGRLAIFPKCKIGDKDYLPIDFQNKIYTGKVEGFEYVKMRNTWVVKIRTDDGGTCYEAFDDLGKTFFIDVEDAAKVLKEMKQ